MLRSLLLCVFALAGCASSARPAEDPVEDPQRVAIEAMIAQITPWAPVWDEGVALRAGVDSDGDATLWNGMLCSSGDEVACSVVKASQGADGRVWRSPRRIGQTVIDGKPVTNSFSRDMLLGGLLYLIHTKDVEFGQKWAAYVKAQKRLCTDDTDQRCRLSPVAVGFWNYVADKVGFDKLPYSIAVTPKPSPTVKLLADPIDAVKVPALDRTLELLEPTTPAGFQLHLLSINLYMKSLQGEWNPVLQHVAERLVKRAPRNAWFLYLAKGADKSVADLTLDICPKEKPATPTAWIWEKADVDAEKADSMGWPCIFLGTLLTK